MHIQHNNNSEYGLKLKTRDSRRKHDDSREKKLRLVNEFLTEKYMNYISSYIFLIFSCNENRTLK